MARTYSYGYGSLVAAVRPPVKPGWSYSTHTLSTEVCTGDDPYEFDADAPAPLTYEEARFLSYIRPVRLCEPIARPWVNASRWELETQSFDVRVDLGSVLKEHGPGVYTITLWAVVGGKSRVVSVYPIFHETERPDGYGSQ